MERKFTQQIQSTDIARYDWEGNPVARPQLNIRVKSEITEILKNLEKGGVEHE